MKKSVGETMSSVEIIEETQDEIIEACVRCGVEQLLAYWDEELEYYIYLHDTPVCSTCVSSVPQAEALSA